jgi:hypothetical protein
MDSGRREDEEEEEEEEEGDIDSEEETLESISKKIADQRQLAERVYAPPASASLDSIKSYVWKAIEHPELLSFGKDSLELLWFGSEEATAPPGFRARAWDEALDAESRDDVQRALAKFHAARTGVQRASSKDNESSLGDLCAASYDAVEVLSCAWNDARVRSGELPGWNQVVATKLSDRGVKLCQSTFAVFEYGDEDCDCDCDALGSSDALAPLEKFIGVYLRTFHAYWKYFIVLASKVVVGKPRGAPGQRQQQQQQQMPIDTAIPDPKSADEFEQMQKNDPRAKRWREAMLGYWFVACTDQELADRKM